MGVGEAIADKKVLENARADMEKISGQTPGDLHCPQVGCGVQDSRRHADRLQGHLCGASACTSFSIVSSTLLFPRIRDFRGLNPKSFDKQGNYSMGVTEQIIFPEIDYDQDRCDPWVWTSRLRRRRVTPRKARRCSRRSTSRLKVSKPMAKKSMIQRELKRAKLVAKYAEKRKELKAIIRNVNSTDDERRVAQAKLNARCLAMRVRTRQRNRCSITGRPHGVLSQVRPGPQQATRGRYEG